MPSHDSNVANASPALVRSDFNNALVAMVTNFSSGTAPSAPIAFQWWVDTANNLLKIRNSANNAWITVGIPSINNLGLAALSGATLTGALLSAVGSVGAPGIAFAGDTSTGYYRVSANTWGLVSGGVEYLRISPTGIELLGTGATTVPSGTTAQRPGSPVNGMIRYNSDLTVAEAYVDGSWKTLATATHPFSTSDFNDKVSVGVGTNIGDYSGTTAKNSLTPLFPWSDPVKLSDPVTVPTGTANGVSCSPNSEYVAAAHSITPFLSIYIRNGGEIFKLPDPATLPTGTGNTCAFSPNGEFLAVGHGTTPFITIYQRSGSTFTKLTDPATLPASAGLGVSWSPNGEFLSVAHATTPFVTIYRRSGTTFTKLTDPATLPTGAGKYTHWSYDGRFLAVGHTTSPYVTIYERTAGSTFTKISDPAILPAGDVSSVGFSPNGEFLICGRGVATPFFDVYQISGTTFTKITSGITGNPSSIPNAVAWSPDSRYVAFPHSSGQFISIFERSGTTFTKLPNLTFPLPQTGNGAVFSRDGKFLACAHSNPPRLTVYQTQSDMPLESILTLNKKFRSGT